MRNLFIISSDKPSRLHNYTFDGLALSKKTLNWKEARHVYITNDEEIKVGDWLLWLSQNKTIKCEDSSLRDRQDMVKKIILTTDQDLIKDGVQAIDDEFLEWFVKNPSCEMVEVEPLMAGFIDDEPSYYENMYKIIIPKEEPKQKWDINTCRYWDMEIGCEREKCICENTPLKEHDYLQGFINQFQEDGEHQELSNDDWSVSRFLEWLKHNNFKINKNG